VTSEVAVPPSATIGDRRCRCRVPLPVLVPVPVPVPVQAEVDGCLHRAPVLDGKPGRPPDGGHLGQFR